MMAAAGLRARMQSLDMLANNLANAATGGYKSDYEFYSLYAAPEQDSGAHMPLVEKPWTDLSQGTLRVTGNPTDIALSGAGMLAVNAPGRTLYTRNGSLRISAKGELITTEGHPVRESNGGVIRLDLGQSFEIGPDGIISQGGQAIGRLAITEFAKGTSLVKAGNNYFQAAPNVVLVPAVATEVQQGKLEDSNVSPANGAVRLVGVMRQFEMLQKAIGIAAEMNRKAVEEVARV
jgi:flagellar basal body rod protein FlgG